MTLLFLVHILLGEKRRGRGGSVRCYTRQEPGGLPPTYRVIQ